MVRACEFSTTTRQGRRGSSSRVVMHVHRVDESDVRVGFVVSKAIGNSVIRHRVTRQLRHIVAAGLPALPAGTRLVVRALPPAKGSSSAQLSADLHRALARASS